MSARPGQAQRPPPAHEPLPLFLYGASGMLAGELLRLLEGHPGLALAACASREARELAGVHPHLAHPPRALEAESVDGLLEETLARGGRAACVLALPHGESARAWLRLEQRLGAAAERLVLVDLAADFRLADAARWEAVYGHAHPAPEALAAFVYGLPELAQRPLAGATRIAAPGCFATAMQLAVVPAARAGLLDPERPWLMHAITGSSGSGNEPKPGTHHPHRHGNLWAYSLGGHRHEAELLQALAPLEIAPEVQLVPCSGPFARGIHLTASLPLARATEAVDARADYARTFEDKPFVELLESGAPDLRSVAGSNRAKLAVHVRGSTLHVVCTLDNLVKGGAGQALQALNLALGLPETAGLPRAGTGVC